MSGGRVPISTCGVSVLTVCTLKCVPAHLCCECVSVPWPTVFILFPGPLLRLELLLLPRFLPLLPSLTTSLGQPGGLHRLQGAPESP